MSTQEMETVEVDTLFSLSQSDICRLCGLSNEFQRASGFLIYEKLNDDELTIADLINNYLPVQVNIFISIIDLNYATFRCPWYSFVV